MKKKQKKLVLNCSIFMEILLPWFSLLCTIQLFKGFFRKYAYDCFFLTFFRSFFLSFYLSFFLIPFFPFFMFSFSIYFFYCFFGYWYLVLSGFLLSCLSYKISFFPSLYFFILCFFLRSLSLFPYFTQKKKCGKCKIKGKNYVYACLHHSWCYKQVTRFRV